MDFGRILELVHEKHPLVQCITNFVTVNDCANILLAAGAAPTMSEDIREVEETVASADALVCNLGAVEKTDSMILAGKRANALHKPVVLDPVAAGATTLRRRLSAQLLGEVHFDVIRGNASEIRGLAAEGRFGSGVDVGIRDVITEENLPESVELIRALARKTGSVIAVSGALDVVSDGKKTAVLRGGCGTMARITGSGCMLTTLTGGFCGVAPEAPFEAACAAMAAMNVCAELAERRRIHSGAGNATFRTDLIDAVFNLTGQQLTEEGHYEIF